MFVGSDFYMFTHTLLKRKARPCLPWNAYGKNLWQDLGQIGSSRESSMNHSHLRDYLVVLSQVRPATRAAPDVVATQINLEHLALQDGWLKDVITLESHLSRTANAIPHHHHGHPASSALHPFTPPVSPGHQQQNNLTQANSTHCHVRQYLARDLPWSQRPLFATLMDVLSSSSSHWSRTAIFVAGLRIAWIGLHLIRKPATRQQQRAPGFIPSS